MKKTFAVLIILITTISAGPRKITWVAIGDSITYLNDHPDETGNRITKGYMTLITEKHPQVRYINHGHNGWTAGRIAEKIGELGVPKADVYTIFLGTNDWWSGRPVGTPADYKDNTGPATLYGSFRVIIDHLRQLNKKARLILVTPLQRGDFVYINNFKNNAYGSYREKNGQHLEQFANAILDIGKLEKIPVADLYHDSGITLENMVKFKYLKDTAKQAYRNFPYPAYIDIPFQPETDEYPYPEAAIDMTYDGLHPSDKGYALIAGQITRKWKRLR